MKIVSTGATLSSPEHHSKKQRERARKRVVRVFVTLVLSVSIIVISHVDRFLISNIAVEGSKVITEEEVTRSVQEALVGKYLGLFPRANAAIYPTQDIENNILMKFPRISSVAMSLDGLKVLKVKVAERDPFALYCPSAERLSDATACYFLDAMGFIFDEAPAFSGQVYFIYVSETPFEEPKGNIVMPADEFVSTSQFIKNLSTLGLRTLALKVGEREMNLILPGNTRVLWNRGEDYGRLYTNLEAFLKDPSIREQKDFFKKLMFLDLRTENKVFYRFYESR